MAIHSLWKRMTYLMRLGLFIIVSLIIAGHSVATAASLRLLTEEWAPMSYEQDGLPHGYMIELVNLLKTEFTLPPSQNIEILPWARGYAIAQSSSDVMLFATSINDERLQMFDFVGPVATTNIYLYTSADDPIMLNSVEDIPATDTVGVYRDSIGEGILEKVDGLELLVASFPHQSARQLVRKRVRFWSQADVAVEMLLKEIGSDISQIKPVLKLSQIELYFAFSRGTDKQVIEAWYQALLAVQQSGQFDELYQQWFHNLSPPQQAEIIWRQ
ncbi:ABC transporter substrate-binding protein [Shewanella sp. Scap07]|uniref:substrate-binding periplasmic protein n=1 Tax=Shewanella sp. Scap07 TaxID=2589987 RepID=UPI00277B546B|nr:ABC transporter substrate-binding protein [Shewanella sp. Scap07]